MTKQPTTYEEAAPEIEAALRRERERLADINRRIDALNERNAS